MLDEHKKILIETGILNGYSEHSEEVFNQYKFSNFNIISYLNFLTF